MPAKKENPHRFKSIVFHALSDEIRLEIVSYLRDGEKCVCEIVPHLNLVQPLISRHLKILKEAGIVRSRREGTRRMYSIVDPHIYDVIDALTPKLVCSLTNEIMEQMTC